MRECPPIFHCCTWFCCYQTYWTENNKCRKQLSRRGVILEMSSSNHSEFLELSHRKNRILKDETFFSWIDSLLQLLRDIIWLLVVDTCYWKAFLLYIIILWFTITRFFHDFFVSHRKKTSIPTCSARGGVLPFSIAAGYSTVAKHVELRVTSICNNRTTGLWCLRWVRVTILNSWSWATGGAGS